MAHQYRQRILVSLGADGEPGRLLWRGATYTVAEVLGRWHLRDRWWAPPGRGEASVPVASDRHYYRLRCAEGLLCEVYWDAAVEAWTLDRVLD
jgi:hypothetical protein